VAFGLAFVLVMIGIGGAAAQGAIGPRISLLTPDWSAAMRSENISDGGALARLNDGSRLQDVGRSPVPVLLPSDPTQERGFGDPMFFAAGPSGYDAAFVLAPDDIARLAEVTFKRPLQVEITGSLLDYELDVPAPLQGQPVPALEGEFPGLRRLIHEGSVRYTFVRFGVPYTVSILCRDVPYSGRRLSCRAADRIAAKFLRLLRIAGGQPLPPPPVAPPSPVERPVQQSPDFTYHAPGRLLPGTGYRRNGGVADYTVYARIRFPLADAPAYANSQSFMNWGDCNFTGRTPRRLHAKGTPYRCRVSGKPLVFDESANGNYEYPWRDNFCETRDFSVGQCPAGWGHQGQDIRPSFCKLRNVGADRCMPYQHDVVAVRDAAVLRRPQLPGLHLVVNAPGEHIRFRYLHMSPKLLDEAGVTSGRRVSEGDVLGKVGNYFRFPGGTTYHLHFDLQVPTRNGWVFVNPYMTLVTSYERLIGGRGAEIGDAVEDGPNRAALTPP
jgi:hypothetical protein